MIRPLSVLLLAFPLGSCGSLGRLTHDPGPPGDYGRPAVVRAAARTGSYLGATVGIAAYIPVWLVSRGAKFVVDEPLGFSDKEWAILPISAFAAGGHYLLGMPAEGLYFLFYGAWVDDPAPVDFDHVPGPAGPPTEGDGSAGSIRRE